jgi:hypothetical protein
MNTTSDLRDGEFVDNLLAGLGALSAPSAPDDIASIARAATAHQQVRPPSWRRRRVVVASFVFAVLLAAPVLAAVTDNLDRIAELTGVREQPPKPQPSDYAPADAPYVSVQPLMRYAGSTAPVVPAAAVVSRGHNNVVFVVGPVVHYTRDSYTRLTAHARVVRVGAQLGKAVVITSGVEPCDDVVVAPPDNLRDGDEIRSYHQENAEGPQIDFANLFAGRQAAPAPVIEGGIARGDSTDDIIAIQYHDVAPPNAAYHVEAPDGSVQEVPYNYASESTEVRISRKALSVNKPVANVQLRDDSGAVIASGSLDWYCTG